MTFFSVRYFKGKKYDLYNGCRLDKTDKTGIQWTITTQLHDLDYADDICLLSQKLQNMQAKINNLELIAGKTGLIKRLSVRTRVCCTPISYNHDLL